MRKVLIIDSDPNIINNIPSFLEDNGFDVLVTKDGASGVQKTLEFLPDIILCNSEANGLSGYEVFNTLQQINSTAIIPFVFFLDQDSANSTREVMNMGIDDYLIKPFNPESLATLIETRLEKQDKITGLADEKFNALMDFSSDGTFIYSDEKFKYVNRKFCDILSYKKRDLLGVNLVNIVFKDDISMVAKKIERALHGIKTDLDFEFRAMDRNQSIIKVSLSGSCVKIRGKNSIIGTIHRNDKNKLISKPLKQNHALSITNREKEVLNCICEGLTNQKIAKLLNISERTVEGHRINLLKKTDSRNSARLAVFAVAHKLYKIT